MAIAARLPVLVLAGMLLAACAIERSAPVDTSASRPFGESEFGESETAPTRDDVVAYARRYVTLRWVAGPEHLFHGVDADGVRLDTADARHVRRGGWEVGENIGMPYRWGGFDTPEEFARKVSLGWPAGHVEWSRDAPASKHAAGIDCSGLVSRSWGLTRKASTRDFPAISVALSDFASLLPGDILDKEDAHVLLFESFVESRTDAREGHRGGRLGRQRLEGGRIGVRRRGASGGRLRAAARSATHAAHGPALETAFVANGLNSLV